MQVRIASLARDKGTKAIQFMVIVRDGEIVAFVETNLGHVHGFSSLLLEDLPKFD